MTLSRLVGVNSNVLYVRGVRAWHIFLFTRDCEMTFRSTCICHLCRSEASVNHTTALFSHAAMKQELATRIGDLLNVVVAANDCLPQHVCDRCMQRVKTLERAAENLVDLVMVNVSFVVSGLCFHTSKQQAEQSTA